MAKGANQKLKMLYIRDYLRENSNFEHPVPVAELIAYLKANGIEVERKTVYDDIAQLQLFGEDICLAKGRNGGYYYDSAEFSLPEIKMLVDSVQSSKFITENQSLELIKKLEKLTNKYDANQLHRQVVVHNRVKTEQTNIFSNIDHISNAIVKDTTVKFRYIKYDIHKNSILRHGGKVYEISPYCLIWEDENYYLLGFDDEAGIIKHFRVDKMKNLSATENRRKGHKIFDEIDISSYNKKVFSMYHGEETKVKIRFRNNLVGVVLDRFGMNAVLVPEVGGEYFTVTADITVSKQFYSWLFGFSGECEILSPDSVREEMKRISAETIALYK